MTFAKHPIIGVEPLRAFVAALVGRTVVGVRRILYVYRGETDESHGAVELTFADGSVVLLQVGPTAQELAASEAPYDDPFLPPLSPENEEFVRTHGKWTVVDVSDIAPYAALIGEPVLATRTIEQGPCRGLPGFVHGAVIGTARHVLRIEILFGEEYVSCWPPEALDEAAQPSGYWNEHGYVATCPRFEGPPSE